MNSYATALVWLRRDLRLTDHAALARALSAAQTVYIAFIFDRDILDPLLERGRRADRRVEFIAQSVTAIDGELRRLGSRLIVRHDSARVAIPSLAQTLAVDAVFASHDYEPAALARDETVQRALEAMGKDFVTVKDQVVLEKNEVLTGQGTPFSVFTPYQRAWRATVSSDALAEQVVDLTPARLALVPAGTECGVPALDQLGFAPTDLASLGIKPGAAGAHETFADFLERIDHYRDRRDFPAVKGPSYLSVHLRFGTISIRTLVRAALSLLAGQSNPGAETWLSELIWREFYAQILWHHPHVVERSFRPEYDAIVWEEGSQAEALFEAWCNGKTGYPIVDAAMRQINQTGYMHNRLRMIAASFLVKDLGIDWRRGEAYFALHLNDFDLASNNGGWQWAASTGCDAQPYFRIFNPTLQSKKFDPTGKFMRRYLPELARLPDAALHEPAAADASVLADAGVRLGADYPAPLVDHFAARDSTLARYGVVKGPNAPPLVTSSAAAPVSSPARSSTPRTRRRP